MKGGIRKSLVVRKGKKGMTQVSSGQTGPGNVRNKGGKSAQCGKLSLIELRKSC